MAELGNSCGAGLSERGRGAVPSSVALIELAVAGGDWRVSARAENGVCLSVNSG
ncbi:hypothetical protein KCP75_14820 [Salmonella enterica subsp. enterica]|nr:hypothetical protein KCP75_14820 [Salmonella enterica subsp. enterica]